MIVNKPKYSINIKIFILVIFSIIKIYGQNNSTYPAGNLEVKIKGVATSEGILLRWVPTNYVSWMWGNKYGYIIERHVHKINGNSVSIDTIKNSKFTIGDSIKPFPENQLRTLAATENLYGVAGAAIYAPTYEVENITKENIVYAINKDKERDNRYGYCLFAADQSFNVAISVGLGIKDTNVQSGYEYSYKIKLRATDSMLLALNEKSRRIITSNLFIIRDSLMQIPKPSGLKGVGKNRYASLGWYDTSEKDNYTSYNLERSDNNGLTFTKRNLLPIVMAEPFNDKMKLTNLYYEDSIPQNNITYIYRLRANTPFGILSPPSDTIQIIGKADPINIPVAIDSIKENTKGNLTINWSFEPTDELKINGFNIYTSFYKDSGFVKISSLLPTSTRQFVVSNAQPYNYYILKVIDKNDYEVGSLPYFGFLRDEIPPTPPNNISGEGQKTGVIYLKWNKSPDNDILGYRVFVSDMPNGDYIQVTPTYTTDTIYNHQINLNTLRKKMYYKIASVDLSENLSDLSAMCEVVVPDIIPPSYPVMLNALSNRNDVTISWVLSTSSDVVRHELQRKSPTSNWTTILTIPRGGNQTSYLDNDLEAVVEYLYRIQAYDEAENSATSEEVDVTVLGSGIQNQVSNLSAKYNYGSKSTNLSWEYNETIGIYDFLIFRKLETDPNNNSSGHGSTGSGTGGTGGGVSNPGQPSNTNLKLIKAVNPENAKIAILKSSNNVGNPNSINNNNKKIVYYETVDNEISAYKGFLKYSIVVRYNDGSTSDLCPLVTIEIK